MLRFRTLLIGLLAAVHFNAALELPRPYLTWESYQRPGDVMLGGLFPIHGYDPVIWCSKTLLGTVQTQFLEAMAFAVERINRKPNKLHNLTLGFIIYDDCAREMVALSRALSFVGGPRSNWSYKPQDAVGSMATNRTRYSGEVDEIVESFNKSLPTNDQFYQKTTASTNHGDIDDIEDSDLTSKGPEVTSTVGIPYHKVIGVVGPMRSLNTILAAELFTLFRMPQISAVSTADDLSNKAKYPYFLRMVPPDQNQAEAIVSFLKKHGWTYFSAIYSQGSYGLGGMNRVRRLAREANMCVAYLKEVNSAMGDADFDDVIRQLRRHGNAKAVVMFANAQEARSVIEAAGRAKVRGEFVWIISDGLSSLSSLGDNKDILEGSFMVQLFSKTTPDFDDYFQGLTPRENRANPWFQQFWEVLFKCSFRPEPNTTLCTGDEEISAQTGYKQDGRVSLFIDLIQTYALAIEEIIQKECESFTMAEPDKAGLVKCIEKSNLIYYLKKQVFWGHIGKVKFDSNGDMLGLYSIKQVIKIGDEYDLNDIALWGSDRDLVIDSERIDWQVFVKTGYPDPNNFPESVCSKPCGPGELVFIQEVFCCWECHKCRPNEVTDPTLRKCTPCSLGYWPSADQKNCLKIKETYLSFPSIYAVVIAVIVAASLLVEGGVIIAFIKNRRNKLIKATSRELSFLMLFGLTLGLLTNYALVTRPNYQTCVFCRVSFHMSVTICYSALLVRTNRIYRIFEAGRRTKQRPPLIGTTAQIVFTIILIAIQVVITSVTTAIFPPKPILSMPIVDTEYVELSCDLPIKGLVLPLSYNLLLIALSTFFGFKIRRLPENFNESKCIFVCACTTLFVFSAFLPTYFVALYSHYKSMLLALCLILNADVILLMLFMPRVYALYWVDDESIVYGDTKRQESNATATSHATGSSSNRPNPGGNLNAPSVIANNKVGPGIIEIIPNPE